MLPRSVSIRRIDAGFSPDILLSVAGNDEKETRVRTSIMTNQLIVFRKYRFVLMNIVNEFVSFLKDSYSKAESRPAADSKFGMYFNLIRVGTSIMFAAIGLISISMLLFAPTFSSIPFGRTGQVILGVFTSMAAFKLYKFFKMSNITFLTAGRGPLGKDKLSQFALKTGLRRFISSIFAIAAVFGFPYLGFHVMKRWEEETGYQADGFLANIGPELDILLMFSVITFLVGVIMNFVGSMLVFWAVTNPFRTVILSSYRFLRYKLQKRTSNTIERITGLSFYMQPEVVCEQCYNTHFKFVEERSGSDREYDIICTKCLDTVGSASIGITETATTDDMDTMLPDELESEEYIET